MIRKLSKDELGLLAPLGKKAFGRSLFLFNINNPLYVTGTVLGWFTDKTKQLIAARLTHRNFDDKQTMYVDYIVVNPEYQNKGVAEQLSEYGTKIDVAEGARVFLAWVNPWNSKGSYYAVEKIGYRVRGTDPNKQELVLIERDMVLNKSRDRDEEKKRDERVVIGMGDITVIRKQEKQLILSRIQECCNNGFVGVSYNREEASFLFVKR